VIIPAGFQRGSRIEKKTPAFPGKIPLYRASVLGEGESLFRFYAVAVAGKEEGNSEAIRPVVTPFAGSPALNLIRRISQYIAGKQEKRKKTDKKNKKIIPFHHSAASK
jgi:hypothetical protein